MLSFPYLMMFVVGACVGSFLNVCIHRLPLEKSLLWPGSRCGHCLQPIRWYDNLPLLSYWLLGGRCRVCGQRFSIRYFLVELLTACLFVGLYYLEVVRNVHGLDPVVLGRRSHAVGPWLLTEHDVGRWAIFAFHATLVCFLLVASFADLEHQAIPLSLTVTGTLVGLAGSVLFPWPWPYAAREGALFPASAPLIPGIDWRRFAELREGLYAWPVWWPLPEWLGPVGNWRTGLATGVAGLLAGTLLLRLVRLLFGIGGGAAYMEPVEPEEAAESAWAVWRWLSWVQRVGGRALGLGDADLMMMAGAFLGWQPVVAAFFVSVFPGLVFAVAQLALRRGHALPFGPSLALGVIVTMLGWRWIVARYEPLFFNGAFLLLVAGVGCGGLLIAAYLVRMLRLMR